MVPAGGPSCHYSRGGALRSLEHAYYIISSLPHSRADRSVLLFWNYVLFLLDSSLFFFLLQWLPVGNVRVTPEALFSFSLFCSPVLSLLSDPLSPSPVSAFTCLPVIWPVRMGGDSDALWSPWSSVATWRHLISLDIPVLAVALSGFQPAQKPHWVMSYVPGSLTSYNLAFSGCRWDLSPP